MGPGALWADHSRARPALLSGLPSATLPRAVVVVLAAILEPMPNSSTSGYQYWCHKALRERYAVRLEGNRVRAYKRLPGEDPLNPADLARYDYERDPDGCRQLEERGGEFVIESSAHPGGHRLSRPEGPAPNSALLLLLHSHEDDSLSHV